MTERVLARIDALDDTLNAFVTVLSDQALSRRAEAEHEILAGRYRGPLHGVPVSIKDLFATKGMRTTAGSRVLANSRARPRRDRGRAIADGGSDRRRQDEHARVRLRRRTS